MSGMVGYEHVEEHDMRVLKEAYSAVYLYGSCVPMAIALSRAYDECLIVASNGGRMVHAGTRTPEGGCRDVRGPVDLATFVGPYGAGVQVTRVDERELREAATVAGGPEVTEADVEGAAEVAAFLHPDSAGSRAYAARVEAFGRDLTDLCRRYGLFLREAYPNGMLLHRTSGGDEAGYAFRRVSRDTLTVARVLRSPDDG